MQFGGRTLKLSTFINISDQITNLQVVVLYVWKESGVL